MGEREQSAIATGIRQAADDAQKDLALAAAGQSGPRTVVLDTPILRGETAIAELIVRKPSSGELRGLSLVDLGQLDVDALHTVLPRITIPTITRQEAQALEPADLMALGAEVAGFLLPKAKRPEFLAS